MKTLRDILPDISDWNEKDIVNEHHISFGVKNKYDKTLHDYPLWKNADCGDGWNGEYSSKAVRYHLQEVAKKWIKELEKQRDLHGEWCSRGVGEYPNFEYPEGFDRENSHCLLGGYDEIIDWIRMFFNLDVEDESRDNTR